MTLSAGQRLGPYEVTALIGKGGMGEVYRALDKKLDRDVALKVLPDLFAEDPARLARFQREARVLASLNHPNIASIYGLEEADGVRALVLELVEGPTLADRIARGPIPLDEALPIAKQIAEALEAAHEAGVIHRDLKPANVKVRPDGTVKVLDFGLAKALEGGAAGDPSDSPTMTAVATRAGVIMGTAAHMSPEQARGKPLDKRTDIWAFGCVLYEMLTGRGAFLGETLSDTIAGILERGPDWHALPETLPANIRFLLRRCLQKDPNRRFHSAADVGIEIEEALSAPVAANGLAPVLSTTKGWQRAVPSGAAALMAVVLALAVGIAVWFSKPSPPSTADRVAHLVVALPPGAELADLNRTSLAFSPDGTHLAYVVRRGGIQPTFAAGRPRLLFRRYERFFQTTTRYDVSPDGQRFLMVEGGDDQGPATQIHVVLNWFEELKQRVPVD